MENRINRIYPAIMSRPLFYKFHKKLWAIGMRDGLYESLQNILAVKK